MFKLPQWKAEWFKDERMLGFVAPDWKTELQMVTMPISTFVALTMCCIEEVATVDGRAYLSEEGKLVVGHLYHKRLRVIENNLRAGNIPGKYHLHGPHYCQLKGTTQWIYDQGWELPEPMLTLIRPERKEKKSPEEFPRSHPKWRPAYEFESEGTSAFYDLIEKYFIDAKGNPIYDPKEWPVKKTLESEWLKVRTLSEADTIITSGKRLGKTKK